MNAFEILALMQIEGVMARTTIHGDGFRMFLRWEWTSSTGRNAGHEVVIEKHAYDNGAIDLVRLGIDRAKHEIGRFMDANQ